MSKPSLIYVLAEDQRHRQFIYRFLVWAGIGPRQMQFEISPSGRGSAEKWVSDNFARQVGKCRSRNSRASTGMFAVLDADTRTVAERLRLLEESLTNSGQDRFDPENDPIARLIPKRNIETWILFLSDPGALESAYDEDRDYKPTKREEEWSELIPSAAESLYNLAVLGQTNPRYLIDSLRRGIGEIPRALSVPG